MCVDGEEEPLSFLEAEKIAEIKEHDADLELKLTVASPSQKLANQQQDHGGDGQTEETEEEERGGNSSGNSSAAEANTGDSDAKR